LERIAALFAIESSIRGRSPELREAARKEHAQPLLEQLKAFLETSVRRVSRVWQRSLSSRIAWRRRLCRYQPVG
jgi:hypothetical protein